MTLYKTCYFRLCRVYFDSKLFAFVYGQFVFSRCLTQRVKGDFSYELISLVGACE